MSRETSSRAPVEGVGACVYRVVADELPGALRPLAVADASLASARASPFESAQDHLSCCGRSAPLPLSSSPPATVPLPTVSIVTPSYNQADYLEAALRSVLDQSRPPHEYVVIDGGSIDGSRAILERYADRLHHWVSEKDDGQYAAIQKGFEHTTGEIMAWLNSDDMYLPGALEMVAEIFAQHPEVAWISTLHRLDWDDRGRAVAISKVEGFSREAFLRGEYLSCAGYVSRGFIQQESTFWRRSLWEAAGGRLDTSLKYAGDFDLWARFYQHARLYGVNAPLGGYRVHAGQKSQLIQAYVEEALASLKRHGGKPYGTNWLGRTRAQLMVPTWNALPSALKRRLPRRSDGDLVYHPLERKWKVHYS